MGGMSGDRKELKGDRQASRSPEAVQQQKYYEQMAEFQRQQKVLAARYEALRRPAPAPVSQSSADPASSSQLEALRQEQRREVAALRAEVAAQVECRRVAEALVKELAGEVAGLKLELKDVRAALAKVPQPPVPAVRAWESSADPLQQQQQPPTSATPGAETAAATEAGEEIAARR